MKQKKAMFVLDCIDENRECYCWHLGHKTSIKSAQLISPNQQRQKKQETCRDENGIDDDVEDDTAEYGDYFILMELVQLYSRLTFKLFNFCFFCSVMIYAPC